MNKRESFWWRLATFGSLLGKQACIRCTWISRNPTRSSHQSVRKDRWMEEGDDVNSENILTGQFKPVLPHPNVYPSGKESFLICGEASNQSSVWEWMSRNRDSVSVDSERGGGLEVSDYDQVNTLGHLETPQRRTEYWKSCTIRALRDVPVINFIGEELNVFVFPLILTTIFVFSNDKEKYYKKVREFSDTMKKKDWMNINRSITHKAVCQ